MESKLHLQFQLSITFIIKERLVHTELFTTNLSKTFFKSCKFYKVGSIRDFKCLKQINYFIWLKQTNLKKETFGASDTVLFFKL